MVKPGNSGLYNEQDPSGMCSYPKQKQKPANNEADEY
jgi:hypothetical protein